MLITATVTNGWGSAPVLHDNPLQAGITIVKALHITELRAAIDAVRSHLGMSAYSWQYSVTTNDWISANPILEMRTALDQALGAPSGGYAAGLAQGQPVKAVHIQELRDRVLAAWVSSTSTDVRWLVTDQLGTPRIILDQSGSLANVSRHDYLPFGEELFAGTGGRTTTQGYTISGAASADGARQKFTGYEADAETGLNFAQARYQSSTQGRFTSPDPFGGSMSPASPQSFNRYSYVGNNPVNRIDPSGLFDASDQVVSNRWAMSQSFGVAGEKGVGGDHVHDFDWVAGLDYIREQNDLREQVSVCVVDDAYDEVVSSDSGVLTGTVVEAPQQAGGGVAGPGANATPQSAAGGSNSTTVITYSDGTQEVRSGGTWTWRNNNPGNIRPARNPLQGDIGRSGGFTVFSTLAAGDAAIVELLNRPYYQNKTVGGAIREWAPARDRNNPVAYAAFVQRATGISSGTQMNTLTASQIRAVADAIRSVEGFRVGTVTYRRP